MMVFYWMLNVLTKVFMMVLGAMTGGGSPFKPDKEPDIQTNISDLMTHFVNKEIFSLPQPPR